MRRVCAGVALAFAVSACGKQAPPSSVAQQPPLSQDPRLDYLLAPCARNAYYDVDTSDATAILIEALLHGQRDTLRRAREELGASPEGVAAVARVVDAYQNGLDAAGPLRNSIDVLTRTNDSAARVVLLRLIENREEGVAVLAAEGLAKHGTPADYDAVRALFDATTYEFRSKVADVLYKLDPQRADQQYLQWMEAGQFEELWPEFALKLTRVTDPALVARCQALSAGRGVRFQLPLLTPAAHGGDAQALALLRESLHSEHPDHRRLALECFNEAGLGSELLSTLHSDPDPALRALALGALATPERIGSFRADISAALGDSDEATASLALRALADFGDSAAIERALALLDETDPGAIANGMRALRASMDKNPALAQRVFERLSARRVSEERLSFDARSPVLQAIGQVPTVEAARALHELSRTATGVIFGMPVSRWLVMQAGNTTAAAQPYFRAQLELEKDARRRLDLLEALAMKGGDGARAALIELIDGDSLTPYETLYVADRLVRIGPAAVIAPLLKRVTLRVTQNDVRSALQCLLWTSYPGPR